VCACILDILFEFLDMVDLELWRARIGLLRPTSNLQSSDTGDAVEMPVSKLKRSFFLYCAWPIFVFVPCIAYLLMCSGDIELNPGPRQLFKNFPSCHQKVHIKHNCGYTLCKNNKGRLPPSRAAKHLSKMETTAQLVKTDTANTCEAEYPLVHNETFISDTLSCEGNVTVQSTGHSIDVNCGFSDACETEHLVPPEPCCTVSTSSQDSVALRIDSNITAHVTEYPVVTPKPVSSTALSSEGNAALQSTGHSVDIVLDNTFTDESLSYGSIKSELNFSHLSTPQQNETNKNLWSKYIDKINLNRRCKYHSDPNNKIKKHQYYASKARYHSNRALHGYYSNHAQMKKEARERYHSDPTIKKRAHLRYHSDPDALTKKSLNRYYSNPTKFSQSSLRQYYANREKAKAKKRIEYIAKNKEYLNRHKIPKMVALSISKKYNRLKDSSSNKLSMYVSRLV